MSYNILNKNVNFQGATQGTVEDIVDTHTNQSISGSKDFLSLTASVGRIKNDLTVIGNVSASVNVSASAFYGDGSTLSNIGTVNFDGSTADGILTYKDADEATVESNLTFDGSVLNFKNSSISGSGNVSGSIFYGSAAGLTGLASAITLATNSGLEDSSGLRVNPNGAATLVGSIADSDSIIIYSTSDSAPRKATVAQVASRAVVPISSYTNGSALADKVVVSVDSTGVKVQSNLSFDNSMLALTGNMSGSGNYQIGGTLNVAGDISGSGTLYVDSTSGRVGIGTDNPQRPLHVSGVGQFGDSTVPGDIKIYGTAGSTPSLTLGLTDMGAGVDLQFQNASGDFKLAMGSGINAITALNSNGNVGIGVTDPDSKLEVLSSTTQLKLSYDASTSSTFAVNSAGKLTVTPSGGDIDLAANVAIHGNATIGDAGGDALTINPIAITIPNVVTGTLANANSYLGVNSSNQIVKVTASAGGGTTDIDALSALGGTGLHQTDDHFMFSDDGTEKKITFSNLQDAIFADVSGDGTIAAGGALTLNLAGLPSGTPLYSADSIAFIDADDGNASKKMTISTFVTNIAGDGLVNSGTGRLEVAVTGAAIVVSDRVGISGSIAGDGLSYTGGVNSILALNIDLNELAGAGVDTLDDSFAFIDGSDNVTKKESINDLITAMAGGGLANSSGTLYIETTGSLVCGTPVANKLGITGSIAGTGLGYSGGVNSISAINLDLTDVGFGGGANRIVTDDGDGTVTCESDLTFNSNTLTFGSTATLTVADSSGTDVDGRNLTIQGGAGTGTGDGGSISFQVAEAGPGTGASVNSHGTALGIGSGIGKPTTVYGTLIGDPAGSVGMNNDSSINTNNLVVRVDSNGGDKTGIRFNDNGTNGQILIVAVGSTGDLTFDGSSSRVNGLNAAANKMKADGTYMFVSNGSGWTFIGGGAATNAQGLQS